MDLPFEITYSCYRAGCRWTEHPNMIHRPYYTIYTPKLSKSRSLTWFRSPGSLRSLRSLRSPSSLRSEMVYYWSLRRGWTPKIPLPPPFGRLDVLTRSSCMRFRWKTTQVSKPGQLSAPDDITPCFSSIMYLIHQFQQIYKYVQVIKNGNLKVHIMLPNSVKKSDFYLFKYTIFIGLCPVDDVDNY